MDKTRLVSSVDPSHTKKLPTKDIEDYIKAFPRLSHTRRLLALHQIQNIETSNFPNPNTLFQQGCLLQPSHILSTPSGTLALLNRTEQSKLTLQSKIPLHTLCSTQENNEQEVARSLQTYLKSEQHTQSTSFQPDNLLYTKQKKVHLRTWVGCHDSVHLFGALGLLGIRATVSELQRLLDGTPLHLENPSVVGVHLKGKCPPFATSRDIAYALMEKLSTHDAPYKTIEFFGEGVATLTQNERFHINTHTQILDALAMLWPIDDVTLSFLTQTERHKAKEIAKTLGLQNSGQDRDCTQTLELDLGKIMPGTTVRIATATDCVQQSHTNTSAPNQTHLYYPTTVSHKRGNTPLKQVVIAPKLTGVTSADLTHIAQLKGLLQALQKKKLTFKIPVSFVLPKTFVAHIAGPKEHFAINTTSQPTCGTYAEGMGGEIFFTSDLFALLFAVVGTMPEEPLPDLSAHLTLKDVWPTNVPPLLHKSTKISDKKGVLTLKALLHWPHNTPTAFPPLDIKEARPLNILRHHDLTTSLLLPPNNTENNDLPTYAHPDILKEATHHTLKKYLPTSSENLLHTNVPLVLFGGAVYGRGASWAWIDQALALVDVRAVVASYFDPTVQRALNARGIAPLTWLPPMNPESLQFTGEETVTIQGISTLSPDAPLTMMTLHTEKNTRLIPLARIF